MDRLRTQPRAPRRTSHPPRQLPPRPHLIHEGAPDADYRNSGWTRGHMIPARAMGANPRALRDSFLLSNAVPQNAQMNRSVWRKPENETRRRASSADSIIVFTGPVFCDGAPKAGSVTVPCALFKILIADHSGTAETFAVLIPNEPVPPTSLDAFTATIDQISGRTGLAFPPPR